MVFEIRTAGPEDAVGIARVWAAVMPQLVMMQIGRRGDFPLASALSIILMAVVTVAYLACARWLKIDRV